MAIRVPRGYAVQRPYYNELCEGVRPVAGATAREAWTGLAHTRVDELHHDPIVLEPGTLVGISTTGSGGISEAAGKLVPALMGTGTARFAGSLTQVGETNTWTLPTTSAATVLGTVKPVGVVYQPIYSFILNSLYTNYKRNTAVGIVTDYVIQVPVTNTEEQAILPGDGVMLGTGTAHGIGTGNTVIRAGRYARVADASTLLGDQVTRDTMGERTVGRCLKVVLLGNATGTSAGDTLADSLANFTISAEASTEFAQLAKVQTVPGLNLTGSGTKGIPGFYLGARANGDGDFFAMTLLIRL
jgi:hypothetical protein